MVTLNLNQKKIPSAENMRLLSSLILSLSSKTGSIEDKCVTPWKAEEIYQANVSLVLKDSELYFCKVTNQDAVWTPSHWELIGKDIDEVDLDTVKSWLNLSHEQLDTLAKIILDSEVRLDKCWSSSHVYSSIQDAINTSKTFTLEELAKYSGASYKVVASVDDMTDESIIYLIANASNSYDMYIVDSDETKTKIGDTTINLNDYLTKQEITDNYYDKATTDGKFATITTVDDKVDKTSITTSISDTPSDEKVASESAVYNKNTINHKVVNGVDILDYASKQLNNFEFVRGFNVINSPYGDTDSPNNDMLYMINRINVSGYCRLTAYDLRSQFTYMNTQGDGSWSGWIRLTFAGGTEDYQTLATPQVKDDAFMSLSILAGSDRDFLVFDINKSNGTVRRIQFDTVEKALGMYDLDYSTNVVEEVGTLRFSKNSYVPVTDVTFTSSNVSKTGIHEICQYCVKNGICYVTLNGLTFSSSYASGEDFTVLPKPAMRQDFALTDSFGVTVLGKLFLELHGGMHLYTSTTPVPTSGFISFSYPVAES